jgi:hypothetical protein
MAESSFPVRYLPAIDIQLTFGDDQPLVPLACQQELLRQTDRLTFFISAAGQGAGSGFKVECRVRQKPCPDFCRFANDFFFAQRFQVTVITQRILDHLRQ